MIQDPIRSSITSAAKEYFGKAEKRYFLRAGNMWLHWSALMLTEKRKDAWTGTVEQARNCRRDYAAAAVCKAVPVSAVSFQLQSVEG